MKQIIEIQLINQLKKHEGFRQFAYKDIVGKNTIGYGRNLDDVGIREEEASYLLMHDIYHAINHLEKFDWYNTLDDIRKAVIINISFNVGVAGLLGFSKMIDFLQKKDYNNAAKEMLDSKWSHQVKSRATELAAQMKSGFFKQ